MSEISEFRDNFKKFVLDVLEEKKITPSELSRITECHETTWDRFLRNEIKMPSSETVVSFADYVKAPLDKIFGRDLTKEIELETSKNKKSQIPAFMTGLSQEAFQSAIQVREEPGKFQHKQTSWVNKVRNEQSKPKGKSR